MNILAIIPARGGSKRLPRKNILPLGGKPLIAWTIESAMKSGICMDIIVSTDDPEIAAVAEESGVRVPRLRPPHLATDEAGTMEVLQHCLDEYERLNDAKVDAVLLLQPTSPFRTPESIKDAVRLFESQGAPYDRTVVSFSKIEHPIEWVFKIDSKEIYPTFGWEMMKKRSQEFSPSYRPNGSIYLSSSSNIDRRAPLIDKKTIPCIAERKEQSIDIDTLEDMELARWYANLKVSSTKKEK